MSTLQLIKNLTTTQEKHIALIRNTMGANISHSGIVDSIFGEMVRVRIVQSSSCSTCKVASYCSSAESKEKIIDVRSTTPQRFKIGQKVNVTTEASNGGKAVILAFAIPAILLLAAVAISIMSGLSEALAALIGILILIPYYLIIYFMNDTLSKEISFRIS